MWAEILRAMFIECVLLFLGNVFTRHTLNGKALEVA